MRRLLAALLLLAVPLAPAPAEARTLRFTRLGSRDGLPSETVTALLRDRDGFTWIGTRAGLALFDGSGMRVFSHSATDPSSLPDNTVRTLLEDRAGALWIGTNLGGLARLDRTNWKFQAWQHAADDPGSLSNDSVHSLAEGRDGGLWVGTQAGLNRLDRATGRFQRFLPGGPEGLGHGYVTGLHEDAQGRLWAATFGGGLYQRDPATGRFTAHHHAAGDGASVCTDDLLSVSSDQDGRVWIGGHGCLDVLDPGAAGFRHLDTSAAGDPHVLVSGFAPTPEGGMWIATSGHGLLEAAPGGGPLRSFRADPASGSSLPGDSVVAVALAGEELWVATYGTGAGHARVAGGLPAPEQASAAEQVDGDVTGILEDADGTLWLGTFGGGLVRVAPSGQPTAVLGATAAQKSAGVLVLRRDQRGAVWAGAMDGLHRVDPVSGAVTTLRHDPGDPRTLGPGLVTAFLEDRAGRRWVGLSGTGVHRLDASGAVEWHLGTDGPPGRRLAHGYVTALLEDAHGTLWIGTRGGLHAVDPASGALTVYAAQAGVAGALPHPAISSLLEDRRGRLWAGTGGGGLALATRGPEGVRFSAFTSADGLVDDDVTGLVEDDDGTLWVSTRAGLSRFDPESRSFASFDAADGLRSAEFNNGAVLTGRRSLFFGTRHGVVEVPRGTPFPRAALSRTAVTRIRTEQGEVAGPAPVWNLDRLEVPYGGWTSFEFAVLDHRAAYRHRYAYRLQDRDPWIGLGAGRELTLAGMAPGSYRLSVRGRDARGTWSEAAPVLALKVVPPLWMTWWFRAAVAVFLLVAVGAWLRWRLLALERRAQVLDDLRAQREVAYQRLRQLTRHLEAVREDERRWIAREVHDEMGQELTAAKIHLQLLGQPGAPEGAADRLRDAVASIDRLIGRVRDLSLDLRPPLLDEAGLEAALQGWLEAVGKRSGVAVQLDLAGPAGRLAPELEIAAFRVVQEATTNALRHAGARSLDVSVAAEKGALVLRVRDDGAGFDVSSTLAAEGAAHLGLSGMRERMQMLGGELEITSTPAGTEVRARLPLDRPEPRP